MKRFHGVVFYIGYWIIWHEGVLCTLALGYQMSTSTCRFIYKVNPSCPRGSLPPPKVGSSKSTPSHTSRQGSISLYLWNPWHPYSISALLHLSTSFGSPLRQTYLAQVANEKKRRRKVWLLDQLCASFFVHATMCIILCSLLEPTLTNSQCSSTYDNPL